MIENMKTIIFDLTEAQPYKKVKFHGGGNYAKEFFVKLAESVKNIPIVVIFYKDIPFQDWVSKYFDKENIKTLPISNLQEYQSVMDRYDTKDNQFIFPLEAIAYKLSTLGIKIKNANVMITIHGLRTIELPNDKYEYLYEYPNILRVGLRYIKSKLPYNILVRKTKKFYGKILQYLKPGDQILTDSEYSKTSILVNFPSLVKADQLRIVYPPIRVIKNPKGSEKINELVKRNPKYMLFISGNRYEKNLIRLLEAISHFDLFKNHMQSIKLVVTGVNSGFEKLIKLRYPNILLNLILIDYPPLEDLNVLFKNATLFLYPSLNEGFGLPPLEAMAHGVPVVASATTSIPEISQDGAEYVDPYNLHDIAIKIYQLINLGDLRDTRIKRGKEWIEKLDSMTQQQWNQLMSELRK